eukprot:7663525-Pyramimonas_sp.AAC.1
MSAMMVALGGDGAATPQKQLEEFDDVKRCSPRHRQEVRICMLYEHPASVPGITTFLGPRIAAVARKQRGAMGPIRRMRARLH